MVSGMGRWAVVERSMGEGDVAGAEVGESLLGRNVAFAAQQFHENLVKGVVTDPGTLVKMCERVSGALARLMRGGCASEGQGE